MLNIFFKSTLSSPSVATWPGEIYNEFCEGILPKEADSQLSQPESGSPMNQSKKNLNCAAPRYKEDEGAAEPPFLNRQTEKTAP